MKGKIKPEDLNSLQAISEARDKSDDDSFGSLVEEDSSDEEAVPKQKEEKKQPSRPKDSTQSFFREDAANLFTMDFNEGMPETPAFARQQ